MAFASSFFGTYARDRPLTVLPWFLESKSNTVREFSDFRFFYTITGKIESKNMFVLSWPMKFSEQGGGTEGRHPKGYRGVFCPSVLYLSKSNLSVWIPKLGKPNLGA